MNILIIEDEERAANRLERLVLELNPTYKIIGKLESVKEGLYFLQTNTPDVILSDIQLADGLSFEIFKQTEVNCPIIFTTAYDQYAISAFETNGIDYLLKPIETERLTQAFNKLTALKEKTDVAKILSLMNNFSAPTNYKNRFMIKVGEKIKSISTEEIRLFYSLEKGTYLNTNSNRNYVVEFPLERVHELLDPNLFFRISRKYIVSINGLEDIIAHTNSRLKIKLSGFEDEEIIVAREKVKEFKAWLDR
jgi:DNA-binding LytR/AlgR family response regulator